jgi:predicted peptidase
MQLKTLFASVILLCPLLLAAADGERRRPRNAQAQETGPKQKSSTTHTLEVVSLDGDFEALNKQVLLYHPKTKKVGKLPLIIYLHGSGGRNKSIEKMKWTGHARRYLREHKAEHTAKILVPQSKGWKPEELNRMLDQVLAANDDVDPNRIYCVGYSMGGKGTWEWGMIAHDRLAAIVPLAFIPDVTKLKDMTKLPIWAMVGTKDSKPRVTGIPAMGKQLKELGSTVVRITVFEGTNHASTAGKALSEPGLDDWLFGQTLKNR